ncbi:MAG: hypothetical protein P1P87_13770 [Trueperaceae bacterium]|nr:hypothetical protein [Trueperaceae bacterium]
MAVLVGVAWDAEPTRYVHREAGPRPVDAGTAPAGAPPDVLLVAFSGRCALTSCHPPDQNADALAVALVPAALAAWREAGVEAEAWTYRAHLDDDPVLGRGFASALADVDRAVREGRLGPGSATRAVLLGYSHGTQFANLLAFERPDVPFASSVMLDAICLGFDDDHAAGLVTALAPGAAPWPAEGPYQVGCDVLRAPGVIGHLDLGDVVPWNVERSLEVRTGGQAVGLVRDARHNRRPDGSRTGIVTADLPDLPDLRHQRVDEPDGAAFAVWVPWVLEAGGGAEVDRARRGRIDGRPDDPRTRCDKTTYHTQPPRLPVGSATRTVSRRRRTPRGCRSSRC